MLIEVVLDLLAYHRYVLHEHQLALQSKGRLKFAPIVTELLIEVPKQIDVVVVRVEDLLHLEGRENEDLARRYHMEMLGLSVREQFHHQNGLLEGRLNVELTLLLSPRHFYTQIALVKLSKSII